MLCRRSASLMTRTLMSRDIATTILRTVSACAASPYLTLSSLVTPSTSSAISSPNSRCSSARVYGVSSMVSCSSAAQSVSVFMPSSARIVATASGWVMYGSPLLRSWPECCPAAISYACSTSRTSAFGCVALTVLISGSSTGLMPPRGAPSLASRRRTPAVPTAPFDGCAPAGGDEAARRGVRGWAGPGIAGRRATVGGASSPAPATAPSGVTPPCTDGSSGMSLCCSGCPSAAWVTPVPAAQESELQHHRHRGHLRAAAPDQVHGRAGGAAGGEHVVDDEDLIARREGILVHLQRGGAVLKLVGLGAAGGGQLPLLAHRDEAGLEPERDWRRQDEPACLDPGYLVDPAVPGGERADHHSQRGAVGEQRGDVLEHDAGPGIVPDIADHRRDQVGDPGTSERLLPDAHELAPLLLAAWPPLGGAAAAGLLAGAWPGTWPPRRGAGGRPARRHPLVRPR